MKTHELLAVAVRVFGLLLFFVTLRDAPNWVYSMAAIPPTSSDSTQSYAHLMVLASFLLIAIFMIKFPATVARMLIARTEMDSPVLEENGEAIQIAGITIVGIYVLTWSIPDLVYNVLLLWKVRTSDQFDSGSHTQMLFAIVVTVVEILIGLYCALGAKGLVGIIRKLRS